MGEEWQYTENPIQHVEQTNGLPTEEAMDTQRTEKSVQKENRALGSGRKAEVDVASPPDKEIMSWSVNEGELEAGSIMSRNNKQ